MNKAQSIRIYYSNHPFVFCGSIDGKGAVTRCIRQDYKANCILYALYENEFLVAYNID